MGDGAITQIGQTAARLTRRAVLLMAAALPLAACWGSETVTRRIRLIATAEIDGKEVQGSTVMELKWRAAGERMYQSEKSEALVLELGGKGTVFVLTAIHFASGDITTSMMTGHVNKAIGLPYRTAKLEQFDRINEATGRFVLDSNIMGNSSFLMVAFGDEAKGSTVYEVKPSDFGNYFGAGVKFKGMAFEFVANDEPLTKILLDRLPLLQGRSKGAGFPRDPDGHHRPYHLLPFAYKMSSNMFFGLGDY